VFWQKNICYTVTVYGYMENAAVLLWHKAGRMCVGGVAAVV